MGTGIWESAQEAKKYGQTHKEGTSALLDAAVS